jgi:hypothetical protein
VTIAITIRTGSSVVFAADSKLTTTGLGGYNDNGDPIWLEQSYDNAFKIAHDRNEVLMAMVVGQANAGRIAAVDLISGYSFVRCSSVEEQNQEIEKLAGAITAEITSYWELTKVEPQAWQTPKLTLAAAAPDWRSARLWKGTFKAPKYQFDEFLESPGIDTDGTYNEVDSLLYGVNWNFWADIRKRWNISDEAGREALRNSKVLMPIHRMNFYTMPTQDAIDLAVFLADVQVQMDRFLPGPAVCGGPIDVMVLDIMPALEIFFYPGKTVHHPGMRHDRRKINKRAGSGDYSP